MRIAFVGGTGPAGVGMAARFAMVGHSVAIGSRSAERAKEAAEEVRTLAPGADVASGDNAAVVSEADVVFLTVPADKCVDVARELASGLAGRIVVSIANPLRIDRKAGAVSYEHPFATGSLAQDVQASAYRARVVSAFHEVAVKRFAEVDRPIDSDTIVCSDDEEAKAVVMGLARQIEGMRPVDAGPMSESRYIEAFVAVLVSINFRNRASVSYRITGLSEEIP